jgi:hypothetical protein
VKEYGEFFHVLLLALITGFCWYARLTAPEDVQLVAVAFLLGSLFKIAKDYLDLAVKGERVQSSEVSVHPDPTELGAVPRAAGLDRGAGRRRKSTDPGSNPDSL